MTDSTDWRPCATIDTLKQRAAIIAAVRRFFADRNVLEVETPLLARHSVTDPHMAAIATDNPLTASGPLQQTRFYLQTSPEYMMKRLLAAGAGAIYQIGKAFRGGEQSRRHNPEFSLLEWYRPGFDHIQLMAEVEALVAGLLACAADFDRLTYRQVFQRYLAIDPHTASTETLADLARTRIDVQMHSDNKDDWLNLLLAELIEPQLGIERPLFVYDYPASQAALAKIATDDRNTAIAQRFELYVGGIELANGYFELTDAAEQRRRFAQDRHMRARSGRPDIEADPYLLAAMDAGLPSCAGVALGIDRLVMLALGTDSVGDVLTFSVDRV